MIGNLLTEKYILQNIVTVLRQTAYASCKVCITKHFALSALCLVYKHFSQKNHNVKQQLFCIGQKIATRRKKWIFCL